MNVPTLLKITQSKHIRLVVVVLVCILLILIFAIAVLRSAPLKRIRQDRELNRTSSSFQGAPQITSLPRISDANGGGIDESHTIVQTSKQSLEALSPHLPYSKILTSSDGLVIEVVIPAQELVSNDWTLLAQIFGIDYQISPEDPSYELMRRAFLTGAQDVREFLEMYEISPTSIIIQWGDRTHMMERANEWLNN